MAARGLVNLRPLSITVKGREFVRDYAKIREFMREIGAKFFEAEPPLRRIAVDLGEGIPSRRHSVLLYEDRDHADLVAAEYFSRGLALGESCIYLTLEDPKIIERRLANLADNVKAGFQQNRIRIYPGYSKTRKGADSLDTIKKLVESSTHGLKPPHRIFGNFGVIAGMKEPLSLLPVEKLFHENFEKLGISLVCWHDLKKIPTSILRRFVESVVHNHHYVVFVSDPSRAFAFDPSLLKTET